MYAVVFPSYPQDSPYPQKSLVHCVTCDALLGEKVAHGALLRATEQVVLEHMLLEWKDQCFLLFQHLKQSLISVLSAQVAGRAGPREVAQDERQYIPSILTVR